MSTTHVTTTITIGDDPPTVQTWPGKHPVIALGDVTFVVLSEDQAYAVIGALREAARFFEDADPGDLRTTTEAEADRNAQQARAELASA